MTPEERIVDYYRRKPFYSDMDERLFTSSAKNDCGDQIFINSENMEWSGSGCAQAIAAAGMMCEYLQEMEVFDVENFDVENFSEEDMLHLFNLENCRRDCVLVAWRALRNALGE